MAKNDYIIFSADKKLKDEVNRVFMECERLGIFLNKKLASCLVAEKSKRGKMTQDEIKNYIKNLRGLISDNDK